MAPQGAADNHCGSGSRENFEYAFNGSEMQTTTVPFMAAGQNNAIQRGLSLVRAKSPFSL